MNAKNAKYMCIKFRIDGAQNFSRMCMCIEFVIQGYKKNKRMHMYFFPKFGMVYDLKSCIFQTVTWASETWIIVKKLCNQLRGAKN